MKGLVAAAMAVAVLAACESPTVPNVVSAAAGPCAAALDEAWLDAVAFGAVAFVGADGETYESVEDLAAAADVVVLGVVGPVTGLEGARDLRPGESRRSLDVVDVLGGDVPDQLSVVFGLGDTAGEPCVPVREGDRVLVFARHGADGSVVVLGSHNNGVLQVVGDRLRSSSWLPLKALHVDPDPSLPSDGGFPPPGRPFELEQVRRIVVDAFATKERLASRPACPGAMESAGVSDYAAPTTGAASAEQAADDTGMGPSGGERRVGWRDEELVRFDYYDGDEFLGSVTVERLTGSRGSGWVATYDRVCR